jgi:hypothetical protein
METAMAGQPGRGEDHRGWTWSAKIPPQDGGDDEARNNSEAGHQQSFSLDGMTVWIMHAPVKQDEAAATA